MGIIANCIEIGKELRRTEAGYNALAKHNEIQAIDSSNLNNGIYLFTSCIDKYQHQYEFLAPDIALQVIKGNLDNPKVKEKCKVLLENDLLFQYADEMKKLSRITRLISEMAMESRVKYSLPDDMKVSPKMIRDIQSLAVSFQRTNLTRELVLLQQKEPRIIASISEAIDEYANTNRKEAMYIAGHFDIVDHLIGQGYDEKHVLLIYRILSAIAYMKLSVFYGFFDKIPEIKKNEDIFFCDKYDRHGYEHVNYEWVGQGAFEPRIWIVKVFDEKGKGQYYQILSKTMHLICNDGKGNRSEGKAVCLEWL